MPNYPIKCLIYVGDFIDWVCRLIASINSFILVFFCFRAEILRDPLEILNLSGNSTHIQIMYK